MFEQAVIFFMPGEMRGQISNPRYHEFRVLVSTCLIGLPLMLLFPILLYFIGKPVAGYLINDALVVITLLCSRYFGHYRIPMTLTALVTYFIIYDWIRGSGLIYSSNISLLHMFLLCAIWADKRYGWWAIFSNLSVFGLIYYQTGQANLPVNLQSMFGGPNYALGINCLITVFFGGFLAYLQMDQERDRLKIKTLQDQKITLLDEVVKQRTSQLNSMREDIATDFHDETGNMLSAITRQATLLTQQLSENQEARPVVESIIRNSNDLYASSKDFLWHLNHDSDNPAELFQYLTAYGQNYYNKFDIAFSSYAGENPTFQFAPSAALNIVYIFKEAMTNVVKHSGAKEVIFEMSCEPEKVIFHLKDNGNWKEPEARKECYGISNMEKRSAKNGFSLALMKDDTGTCITLCVILKKI